MKKNPNIVSTASTQSHLEIDDIRDDIVLLKNGGACCIVRTTAVNFGLLSETEQDSIIYAYAGFLNSLSFPIQILIQSKKMDITSYLDLIRQYEQKQTNLALKNQIGKYEEFIASIIQENKVLDKSFYVVVPFSALEAGLKSSTSSLFGGGSKSLGFSKDYLFDKAKTALAPRRDNIIRLLTRMGLKAQPLSTTELIKLFYEIYNPEEAIGQKMVSTHDYESPMVQPVVDMAMPPPRYDDQPRPQAHASTPHSVAQATRHKDQQEMMHHAQQAYRPTRTAPRPTAPGPNTAPQQAPKPVDANDVQAVLSRLQSEVSKMQGGGR